MKMKKEKEIKKKTVEKWSKAAAVERHFYYVILTS